MFEKIGHNLKRTLMKAGMGTTSQGKNLYLNLLFLILNDKIAKTKNKHNS